MFNEFLTIEGESLLAKAVSGTATLSFTKMKLGLRYPGYHIQNIIPLNDKVMTLDIYSVTISGDNRICVTIILESKAEQMLLLL